MRQSTAAEAGVIVDEKALKAYGGSDGLG